VLKEKTYSLQLVHIITTQSIKKELIGFTWVLRSTFSSSLKRNRIKFVFSTYFLINADIHKYIFID